MKEEFNRYYITNISNIHQRDVDLESIKMTNTSVSESTLVNLKKRRS